ncbi:hypothetical protein SAMN05428989_0002 [Pseudoxanthomonas sp. GM95]|uniref:ABC-three component system protein n=2 Tax=unclassified Pseudoxanthomonas TaxID=2645906 RepID=UPI0008C74514|nr:ABC-three component system protein [Pseudoxanthomonas sp. GM95]SEK37690.1 hypothetical protein SAMN05428989_0002 [Pseudoxanthomonas sp. GM95]
MELLDDVAQEESSGAVKLVQSKSALTANPAADRAEALWKTLSNWVSFAEENDFELDQSIFELYVSRPVQGSIVDSFAAAKTPSEARAALARARDILWGSAPEFDLKPAVAAGIAPYLEKVFSANQALLERLICRFQLTTGSGDPPRDLQDLVASHPVSPSKVGDITDHLCGVVKRRIDELLQAGKPAVIDRDMFHSAYTAYARKIDRETVLLSRALAPTEEVSKGFLPDHFIRQLEIIGLSYEEMLEATSDFFMASFDRTDWAFRGEVDPSSFDDLDDLLKRTWQHKKRACSLNFRGSTEQDQGQALYSDCMQFSASVQAMVPPTHFVPGCFHLLSNDLEVGWHPNYLARLKRKEVA